MSTVGPGSAEPGRRARISRASRTAPRLAGPDPGPARPPRPRSGTHASGPGDGGARWQGGSSPPLTPLQPRWRRCDSAPSASPSSSSSGAGKVTLAGSRHFLTLVDIATERGAARSQQPSRPATSPGGRGDGDARAERATCNGARAPRLRCRLRAVCRPDSIAARRRGFPARRGRREEEGGRREGREDQSLGRLRGAGSRQTSRWGAEKQQKLPSTLLSTGAPEPPCICRPKCPRKGKGIVDLSVFPASVFTHAQLSIFPKHC